MTGTAIGSYRVETADQRLVISRGGLCVRLGLRPPKRLLSDLRPAGLGEIRVAKRRIQGPEAKRGWSARWWEAWVMDPGGEPLSRPFRFRSRKEAERFAALLEGFKGSAGTP